MSRLLKVGRDTKLTIDLLFCSTLVVLLYVLFCSMVCKLTAGTSKDIIKDKRLTRKDKSILHILQFLQRRAQIFKKTGVKFFYVFL